MNTNFHTTQLVRRPVHSKLDDTPIHVGDVVYLKTANGPTIRATVIFNSPINGTITYTTDIICQNGDNAQTVPGKRIRFRHEHVHRIEPLRRRQSNTH